MKEQGEAPWSEAPCRAYLAQGDTKKTILDNERGAKRRESWLILDL